MTSARAVSRLWYPKPADIKRIFMHACFFLVQVSCVSQCRSRAAESLSAATKSLAATTRAGIRLNAFEADIMLEI